MKVLVSLFLANSIGLVGYKMDEDNSITIYNIENPLIEMFLNIYIEDSFIIASIIEKPTNKKIFDELEIYDIYGNYSELEVFLL